MKVDMKQLREENEGLGFQENAVKKRIKPVDVCIINKLLAFHRYRGHRYCS